MSISYAPYTHTIDECNYKTCCRCGRVGHCPEKYTRVFLCSLCSLTLSRLCMNDLSIELEKIRLPMTDPTPAADAADAAREFVRRIRDESGPAHDPHSLLVGFLAGHAAGYREGLERAAVEADHGSYNRLAAAIRALIPGLANAELLALAAVHPPPQAWYDEETEPKGTLT